MLHVFKSLLPMSVHVSFPLYIGYSFIYDLFLLVYPLFFFLFSSSFLLLGSPSSLSPFISCFLTHSFVPAHPHLHAAVLCARGRANLSTSELVVGRSASVQVMSPVAARGEVVKQSLGCHAVVQVSLAEFSGCRTHVDWAAMCSRQDELRWASKVCAAAKENKFIKLKG